MFHGCYHKSFHVKPLVVNDSGITPGKEKGVHDSDYYVEVTVINNALLKTTKTIKVGVYACAARRMGALSFIYIHAYVCSSIHPAYDFHTLT